MRSKPLGAKQKIPEETHAHDCNKRLTGSSRTKHRILLYRNVSRRFRAAEIFRSLPVLQADHISPSFGPIKVLDGVSIALEFGRVHAKEYYDPDSPF